MINNFYPHPVVATEDNSFIGIKIIGNEIHLYYPFTYHLVMDDNPNFRDDILDLLRTIEIAKTASKDLNKLYNSHNINGDFALYSYLWLINDFLSNGFYTKNVRLV